MRVLLIAPYRRSEAGSREDFLPSMALVYLAGFIRDKGHEPILLDLNNAVTHAQEDPQRYCVNKILEKVMETSPDLIGMNCLFSGLFESIMSYGEAIEQYYPDTPIVIGGLHPTTYPREILTHCPYFDYIVMGEGETQLLALIEAMESGDLAGLDQVNGLSLRGKDGEVIVNENKALTKYDELPMPAWDLIHFADYEMDLSHFYSRKGHEIRNVVPIMSERGCPYRCNFCDMFMVMGRKLRRRTATQFVDELDFLVNECGQRYFAFMDDNLTLDKRHIIAICNEIAARGLDIQFDTTAGLNINSLDEEIVEAMVDAGMVSCTLSPEHGNDYIRNEVIKKMLPRHRIYEVVELLQRYPVQIGANWIIGFPEDTSETIAETYQMITELKCDRNGVGSIIPFPGTALFEQVVRDDLFIDEVKDLSNLWRTPMTASQDGLVVKPYKMTMEELNEWKLRLMSLRYKYFGERGIDFNPPRPDTATRPSVPTIL